ncbi:MAG: hypothetical protein IIZ59_01450 [Clostridia bacterium]|nr:hypothetical protein [Clostridia bacterium]
MNEQIDDSELEQINRYTRKEVTRDDVYTFSVVLCDNDIDRDGEHFSDAALDKLAKLFVGVAGIYDHEPSAKNQAARIYSCAVETVESQKTAYGAPYRRLTAKAYVPICESSRELIEMLDGGIRKEVSVGCSVGKCICSICGEDMRGAKCSHVRGKRYGEKVCCGILDDPTDAYEWSFIAVPAQKKAGVIKGFRNEGIGDVQREYLESLRELAKEGAMYKSMLRLEAVKAGVVANIGIDSDLLESMVRELSAEELIKLKCCFEKAASKRLPIKPQTIREQYGQTIRDNSGFDI